MLLDITSRSPEAKASLELVPTDDDPKLRGRAEADLKLVFGKSNRVIVQDIFVQPFSEDIAPTIFEKLNKNIGTPYEQRWQKAPEFKVVTTRLTCIPNAACMFTWLRISFELGDEAQGELRPVACKLYPESSQNAIKLTSKVVISGELTVEVAKTSASVEEESEHNRYEYQINAYGAFSPSPAWDFKETHEHPEITGDLTLLMVIASPPGASNSGELKVSAKAQLRSEPLTIPLVTRRTANQAAAVTFML
jgi:hypothetical protein